MGLGIYVHIPFCIRKCNYCSFISYPYDKGLAGEYIEALGAHPAGLEPGERPDTLYFGGGTPTVVEPGLLAGLVKRLVNVYGLPADAEITVEANPGTLRSYDAAGLVEAGVNRVSIGAQSFDEAELRLLGRLHSPDDIVKSVDTLRNRGIGNIGLDLIYGIPGQDMEGWSRNLKTAVDAGVQHISIYCLSIDKGTPLYHDAASGRIEPAPDGLQADMYVYASRALREAGYSRYEMSNFALAGRECRHNMNYWGAGEYIGLGAGAHSKRGRVRSANLPGVGEYLRAVAEGSPVVCSSEKVSDEDAEREFIMLSLRTSDGLSFSEYAAVFGRDFMAANSGRLARLAGAGYIESGMGRIWLTDKGIMSSNAVISEFF